MGPTGSPTHVNVRNASNHPLWSNTALLVCLAGLTVMAHLLHGGGYGFHRDELATLDDARHLDWGYVAYPPLTPFFARLSLAVFGTSLAGFRFFASLAQATAVVLTGLMARELRGGRVAQLLAAAAAIPFCLASGALMQYVAFDYLWWVAAAYFTIRLLKSDDPRWWIAIGATFGLGMLTKYGILFLGPGLALGLLLTTKRRYYASKWLWFGVAVSLLIWLPNLIWQIQHHFISLEFLKNIHERDVRIGRTKDFLPDQLKLTLLATPLWLAGLYRYLVSREGRLFRVLGWMYVIPLLLFIVAKGRGYYLAGAYPMLYAAGAVRFEQWTAPLVRGWRLALRVLAFAALTADIVLAALITLPIARLNSPLWSFAIENNGDLVEELNWPDLAQTVAHIRDSLPADDRSRFGVLAANYGEAGAINLYGPQFGLPPAISGVNSFWQRGYGSTPPGVLIVLGFSERFRTSNFASCQLAAQTPNPYNVMNEETKDHPDIFICRGLRQPWPEFWKDFRYFG